MMKKIDIFVLLDLVVYGLHTSKPVGLAVAGVRTHIRLFDNNSRFALGF